MDCNSKLISFEGGESALYNCTVFSLVLRSRSYFWDVEVVTTCVFCVGHPSYSVWSDRRSVYHWEWLGGSSFGYRRYPIAQVGGTVVSKYKRFSTSSNSYTSYT